VTEVKLKTDVTKTKHTPEKAINTKHSKTKPILVQSPFMTLGQATRWAYCTTLSSAHDALTDCNDKAYAHTQTEKSVIKESYLTQQW